MKNESIVWCIQNCSAYVMSEDAQVELNNITARIAELEAAHAMQDESLVVLPRHMVNSIEEKMKEQKELLIKAESALTYANWDGEFSKYATEQDVINARDAIRAYLEAK